MHHWNYGISFFLKKVGSWENYRKIATLSFSCSQWCVCVCMCVLGNAVDLWFAYMGKLFKISNLKGTHSLFNSIDMSMQCISGRKLNVMCVCIVMTEAQQQQQKRREYVKIECYNIHRLYVHHLCRLHIPSERTRKWFDIQLEIILMNSFRNAMVVFQQIHYTS